MKILGVERDNTACNHYRVLQPLMKLREHGLADCLTIGDWQLGSEEAVDKVMQADIILFQRPADENWFKFIKLCQKHGKIIVCDYDDDPFNTSPFNPYYKFIGTKDNWKYPWADGSVSVIWKNGQDGFDIERNIQRQDLFRASFRKADMVTTTTPILQESFFKLNKNTVVLPNLIDFSFYSKESMVKKEVRIGYQCGASHYEDLYSVRNVIKEVLKRNDNCKFVYLGDVRFKNLFQEIPTKRFEFHGWVQHITYPYVLKLLNLDIGICPLVDNEFNRNKSALKYFDYSAVGAATVADNIPPYSPIIQSGENGFLASNEKEWIEALDSLVKDKKKRINMSKKAYDHCYENHNADKKAYLWRDAYQSLIDLDLEDTNGDDIFKPAEHAEPVAR